MLRIARTLNVHVKMTIKTSMSPLVVNNRTKRCTVCKDSPPRRLARTLCSLATATPNKQINAGIDMLPIVAFANKHYHHCHVRHRTTLFGKFAVSLDLTTPVVVSPPVQSRAIRVHLPASKSKEALTNCTSHLDSCFIDVKAAAAGSRVP